MVSSWSSGFPPKIIKNASPKKSGQEFLRDHHQIKTGLKNHFKKLFSGSNTIVESNEQFGNVWKPPYVSVIVHVADRLEHQIAIKENLTLHLHVEHFRNQQKTILYGRPFLKEWTYRCLKWCLLWSLRDKNMAILPTTNSHHCRCHRLGWQVADLVGAPLGGFFGLGEGLKDRIGRLEQHWRFGLPSSRDQSNFQSSRSS